jgi:uncharacterized protein YcbX
MHISQINIYPIKSLRGISLESAVVEERGLRHDRRWMLTDRAGKFLTQREFPRMSLIETAIVGDELSVSAEGFGTIGLPVPLHTDERQKVIVWSSICDALVYDDRVNEWFSDVLGTECRLVYMPDDTRRGVNPRFNTGDDVVSFADGYPLMMLGEASLADLNRRIEEAGRMPAVQLPMKRFRPSVVVSGSEAFAEDDWQRITMGEAEFRSTKPCERCVITTVDPSRGEFDGKEPLKTLASFRTAREIMPGRIEPLGISPAAVLFGQNLIPMSPGTTISIGDRVHVISEQG